MRYDMNKFIAILVFALGVNVTMYAQNSSMFGIRKVNTKAGAVVDAPRLNSKHYKIQTSKLLNDVDLTLFFHEYVDGKYKENDLGRAMSTSIPKEHTFNLDFVPELQPNGTFKLYVFYPGVTRYYYMFPEENKNLKFVLYPTTETLLKKPLNVLLVYEDDKDGSMERLVNKYIKNGALKTSSDSDKKLRSMLKRYSVLYYIIDDRKK